MRWLHNRVVTTRPVSDSRQSGEPHQGAPGEVVESFVERIQINYSQYSLGDQKSAPVFLGYLKFEAR